MGPDRELSPVLACCWYDGFVEKKLSAFKTLPL